MIKDNKQIQVAICLFNLAFLVKSNPIISICLALYFLIKHDNFTSKTLNIIFIVGNLTSAIMSMYYLAFYGYQGFANIYLLLSQIIDRINLMRTLY